MPAQGRLLTAGRVGRPHGLGGAFVVGDPREHLRPGGVVTVAGRERRIASVTGTADRPLLRLEGVDDRDAAARLGGELLLVEEAQAPLAEDEWLAEDLVGCVVAGLGPVRRVLAGPSCDVLELDGGTLVPVVSDAVRSIDVSRRRIEVDRAFLGLETDSKDSASVPNPSPDAKDSASASSPPPDSAKDSASASSPPPDSKDSASVSNRSRSR